MEKIFPVILIFMQVFAAVSYWGNWRKTIFWLAATVITFVVTY